MTPEELIEAEAEWLKAFYERAAAFPYGADFDAWLKRLALAHFHQLNGWGVRMIDPYTDPDWPSKDRMRVRPLPEAQTLKAMTFNQAIVELGKAHRTEAKE